jgi:hypothetical protein
MNLIGSEERAAPMSGDNSKIRVVFDCMVFLQGAARRESAAGASLVLVELSHQKSSPRFATYWHVLAYDTGFPH